MDDQTLLLTMLRSGLHQCSVSFRGDGSLMVSLFVAGLTGGVTHCAGMCGPFVLSQVAARLEAVPLARMSEWRRLTGVAVLPYHLGRATTYAALGAVGASLIGSLIGASGLHWVSAGLLLFAALFMLGMAIPSLKTLLSGATGEQGWWSRPLGKLAQPLFAKPVGWRGYLLGVLLGFIPCGLLYGALAAASASGNIATGILGMMVFSLGTMPSLLLVGLVGHLAGQRWRGAILRYAPLLLFVNAGVLILLAWRHLV